MFGQGKSMDEALTNIKDAIKGWLDAEKDLGRILEFQDDEIFLGEVTI